MNDDRNRKGGGTVAIEPGVSVLIPVYNAAPWLDVCLRSVLAQTLPPAEVILVDDGSTDGSAALCDAWAQRCSQVRVIHRPNHGVAAARNAALDAAAGELLLPVDADDWLEPACIEKLYQAMLRFDVPIAACNHWVEYADGGKPRFSRRRQPVKLTAVEAMEGVLYHDLPDVSCWAKLYRREVFGALRYPEGKLYEDTALIAPLLTAAGSLAWIPEPLYHYRIRPDSISRAQWGPEKLELLEAVSQLTAFVREQAPWLERGCVRREAHAAMSVRRYFVHCPQALHPQRDAVEQLALRHAACVLRDPHAPLRDKLALLALRCGPWAYDLLWQGHRRT